MELKKRHKVLLYIALVFVAFIVIFPIIWAVSASIRTDEELYAYMSPASWHTFFPVHVTFEAYKYLVCMRCNNVLRLRRK